MKKFFLFCILAFSLSVSYAQQSVLVSPQWLKDNLNDRDLVVLYTGFVIKADYEREHIEGSRFLWPDRLAFDTPEGSMHAPDAKAATKVLQDLGINKNSKIVICHKGADVTIAARMFLTMEYFGLTGKVFFLNGGIEAWKKDGFPVTNKPAVFKKGDYIATINPVLVDKKYVQSALKNKSSEVVDARVKRWYDGDPTGNPRDGHITGAKNIPYADLIDSTSRIKSFTELQNYFQLAVPDKNREIVGYCFIGQTASVLYLAARELGYPVKIYDGSMQEWSRLPELPMEKTKKD